MIKFYIDEIADYFPDEIVKCKINEVNEYFNSDRTDLWCLSVILGENIALYENLWNRHCESSKIALDRENAINILSKILEKDFLTLSAWEIAGMCSNDENWKVCHSRLSDWADYSPVRKWLERVCDLIHRIMPPNRRSRKSAHIYSFPFEDLFFPAECEIENSCAIHVTWILSLKERRNAYFKEKDPLLICGFASLEHIWLGFRSSEATSGRNFRLKRTAESKRDELCFLK